MKRKNTVAQYIATRPIMDLCEETVRRSGTWVARIWWDKEGLDLEDEKEAAAVEADGEGGSEREE